MTSANAHPTLGYILKGYPRISETFISNEILLLERLGFTIRLFPMRKPRESFSHASVKEIKAGVDYLPTELLPDFLRLIVPNIFLAVKKPQQFKYALRIAKSGLSKGGALATLKHFLQAGYLTNNFLLHEPTIRHLHGHFAHSPTSVTQFASLFSDIPFSFTAHAKDIYTSKKEKLYHKIKRASFVVTCTKHNKEYLQEIAGDTQTPIYCIYHGIDLKLFQPKSSDRIPEEPYKLLTIARMTAKKGLPTIYRALDRLKKRGIKFSHTLIGDGDDREAVHTIIHELGLENCCQLLGTLTHEEVLTSFQSNDLFLLGCEIAKNGDRDGIPNVLVESLAMGVPALSTDVSAIPEILINGKTGITIPPSDPIAMEEAILQLLTNQRLRNKLIENGKQFVENNFDNSKLIKQFAEIIPQHNSHFR